MSDDVTEWLKEIDDVVMETFDFGDRTDAKRTAGSRRKAYERGLTEVHDVEGERGGRQLFNWIQEQIRNEERFPSAREVRKRGAKILRESGHEVSTGNWLGA